MAAYAHKKHFTLDEARKELTVVHALALKMLELKQALTTRGWDVYKHQYFGGMGPNGSGAFPPEVETLVEIVRGFDQRGILVKDLDAGLIDFPCLRDNGDEVYLCWKVGEDDIEFWHGMDEGFAGRKSVNEL